MNLSILLKSSFISITSNLFDFLTVLLLITIIDGNGLPVTQAREKIEYNIIVEEENFKM